MLCVVLIVVLIAFMCLPAVAWNQREFIVTVWCAPPTDDASLRAYASEGYNLTWSSEDGLDNVKRHGLTALLTDPLLSPSTLDDPDRLRQLDELIERNRNRTALEGYWLTDEPGSGAFAGLGRLVAYLREKDPRRLAYINLYPMYASEEQLGVSADAADRTRVGIPLNFAGVGDHKKAILAYKEHLRQFVDIVKPELISYDHYHFLKDGSDGNLYFLNLGLIRESALDAKLPFLNIIQACASEPAWRLVNQHELRWLAYTTLAYGGRGLSYFLYWGAEPQMSLYRDGGKTPLADDVAGINQELRAIGPEMMRLESTAVYQTDPLPIGGVAIPSDSPVRVSGGEFVLGLFKGDDDSAPFMIVNRDYKKTAGARLTVDSSGVIEEFNLRSRRWKTYISAAPGKPITVELAPGEGRLLRVARR